MTASSILGVTLGVAALIIVLSIMGGFEQALRTKMLRGEPHLEILNERALLGFSLLQHPLEDLRARLPEAQSMAAFVQSDVVMKQGKHLAAASLIGIDPTADSSMWAFHGHLIEGQLGEIANLHRPLISFDDGGARLPGVVLGDALAGQLGADLGDELVILSPEASSSAAILTGATLTRSYVVVGIFHSGMTNFDSKWAVTTLDEARQFMVGYDPGLDEERYVTGVAANVADPDQIEPYAARFAGEKGLAVRTWKDANAALLFALKLEKYTMGAILMLIVLVAAFSISGTLMMTVFFKKTQICLLRSIGMTRFDIGRLFLMQGLIVGGVGVGLGLSLGLSVCWLLTQFRYIDMPASLMSMRAWPVKFLPMEYAVICGLALLLCVVGALYPALTASKQNPSSGLRYS